MNKMKGFTLIELVVVITILGIIGIISLPKFLSVSDEAKYSTYRGQLATFESAMRTFYVEKAVTGTARYPQSLAEVQSLFTDEQAPSEPFSDRDTPWVFIVAWSPHLIDRYMELLSGYESVHYAWIVNTLNGDVRLIHPDEEIYNM